MKQYLVIMASRPMLATELMSLPPEQDFFHWSGRREREGSRRVSVPQPVPSLFELEKWVS
jgi:hypothetical protein